MKKRSFTKFLSFFMSFLFILQLSLPAVNVFASSANSSILPPSNLAAQLSSPEDVKLTWSSVYGATGYNVYGITDGQLKLLGTTSTTVYTFNNLPEGSYTYVVSTISSDGESGPCAPVSVDITYPEMTAPAKLTSSIKNGNDIVLSWPSSSNAQTYNIYQIVDGNQNKLIASTAGYTYTITNAGAGSYTYAVSAVNSLYGESPLSSPLQVDVILPVMADPSNLTYKIQNGNDVVLTWGTVNYANSYNVYELVNGQPTMKTNVSSASATFTNVQAGEHTYVVHSVSTRFGESQSGSQIPVTVNSVVMSAPSNLTYSLTNGSNITLKWGTATYATAYNVYQIIDGQKVLKSTLTGTTVTYNNLPNGNYVYEIHSYSDRFGESPDGSQVSVTLGSVVMTPPADFTFKINNGNDIVLNWVSVPNATNYKVYLVTNGQKVLKSTVTGTTVTYANVPAGDYTYKIHSYSSTYGESSDGSELAFTLTFPVMQPPANVLQSIKNATDFSLNWDPSAYATSYKVYQITNGQKVLKNTVTGTTVNYTNMSPGDYTYEIHSYSSRFGESADGSTLTMTLNGQTMDAPTNLTYSIANGNDITLKWTAAAYASSYKIYRVVDGQNILQKSVTGTSAAFTNIPADNYVYIVTSVSALLGESPDGAEVSFSLTFPTMTAPGNLTYKIQNGNSVVLNWGAVSYANSYKVYELIDGQEVLKSTVTTLTATITNVTPGDHTYVVHSVSTRFGESQEGSQISLNLAQTVMSAPANLTYILANVNDIVLNWTAATYANSYKIYQVIDGVNVLQKTVTTTSATFTNMPTGEYHYLVTSLSNTFGESPDGSEVTLQVVVPTMSAPNNLAYSIQNGNDIVLTWGAVTYANSYNVYEMVNGQEVLKATVTSATARISNVPAGDHAYSVHSVSTRFGESSEGSQISLTLDQVIMLPPTGLTNTISNGNDITIKWNAATYATGYNVYKLDNGQKTLVKTLTGTSVTFVNVPAGDLTYSVHSVSTRFGESSEGSQISFTLDQVIMLPPTGLTNTISNGNDITIKWNASTYATVYNVYKLDNGQKTLVKTLTGTSVTFTNMPEGDYTYEVHSYSTRFGESPDGSTKEFELTWPIVQPPVLSDTINNINNITLTWKTASWANEYHLYEVTDGTRKLLYKGTALSYKIYNLTEGIHKYEVTSYNTRFGESDSSNLVTESIIYPDMQSPIATLKLIDSTSALISWDFVTYSNGYNIYEIIDNKPVLIVQNVNNLSYQLNNLSYKDHEYYVTAYSNSFGESQPSGIVIAKLIVDTQAPVTTSNAPANWINQSPVNVLLTATDNITGVANTYYSINDGNFTEGNSFTVDTDGANKLSFYSVDNVGNKEEVQTFYVKIDKTAPVTTSDAAGNWTNKDVTVNFTAADENSGVAKTFYSIDGSDYAAGNTFTVTGEGIHSISFYSVDAAGNIETAKTTEVKIDKTAPVTTSDAARNWTNKDVTVNLTAADENSGVDKTFYSIDGSDNTAGNTFTVTGEGIHSISFYSVDAAGNIETAKTAEVKIDKTAPVTTSDAAENWTNKDVTVNLTAADENSGVDKTFYSIDGSDYAVGNAFTVTGEGIHGISFYSVDAAGNVETAKTAEVKIDKTAPTITMDLNKEYKLGTSLDLAYISKDNLSGLVDQRMVVFGPNDATGKVVDNNCYLQLDKPGVYNIIITATDAAGLTTEIKKQFIVYIPVTIEVTPKVIKGNKGEFTVRAVLPVQYGSQEFDLRTVTLDGVKALSSNNGYYNQAKLGQFKFERSNFTWNTSDATLEFRCYINGYLVVGETTVKIQK